jgi:hypothetical protein
MEMLAFPDIKMRGNGQIGKKGCRQKKGMMGKLADIDVLARHVADMLPTFPTKGGSIVQNENYEGLSNQFNLNFCRERDF